MPINLLKKNNIHELFLGILIAVFLFISFIPGTIALTYILLAFFLIILGYLNRNNFFEILKRINEFKKSLFFLVLFLIWITFQPFIFHDINLKTLSEVRGQFLVPLLFFISGSLFVLSNFKFLTYRKIFNILFFIGFLHVFIVVFMALFNYYQIGHLPIRKYYILNVNEVSYFTNLIYALFLAEVYSRVVHNKTFLFINIFFIPIIFITFIFSIYLQGMRWGIVTFTISSLFFLIAFVYEMKIAFIKKIILAFSIIFMISLMLYGNFKNDTRWKELPETVKIVFNDHSLYWVNAGKYPCPKLENGKCVGLSNYLRLAQFINGLKLLEEFPLGVGYSRRAYQEVVIRKYNDNDESFNFPHSGMINMFIGVGFLGIIFYFLFLFFMIKKISKFEFSYSKLFILFFILAFHSRSFVDMTFMNHNLKVFFFILGIGIFSALKEENKNYEKIKIYQSK